MSESGGHLTTSRVSRLLRPLRNKCNTLVALPKATAAFYTTHPRRSSNWDPESRPPLTVLRPSSGTKKLTLDRRAADDFELSRRIYAVCDAFKNVAYVAYGDLCSERIPSLAAMCSLVIGQNLPAENRHSTSVDSGDSADEIDTMDVDSVYEAVPPHYRRFLIVSHALSMILCICTHHHTLLTVLLDHCLSFGLVHESTHLLHIILAQALLPPHPHCPPSVTHPAHINYLLDLHTKWTTGYRPPATSSSSLLFTTSTFCQAVLSCLSQSSPYNSFTLWTSKALNRLLHAVESSDVDSYIAVTCALSLDFWETLSSLPDVIRDPSQFAVLRDKLSELMSNLFDLLFSQHDAHPHPSIQSRIYAVIDILQYCYNAQLHRSRTKPQGFPIELPDIIIVFSTHILATHRNSIDNLNHILAILDESKPIPQTFHNLMMHLARFREPPTSSDFFEAFFSELKSHSSALRSAELFTLDASLWACALRHFETSVASLQKGDSMLVTKHRRQLMEAVDIAERRCFGGASHPVIPLSIHSNPEGPEPRTSKGWKWECAVDSWIKQTPVHKKQKLDNGCLHTPPRHVRSRTRGATSSRAVSPISTSTPVSTRYRRTSSLSPTSPSSQFSDTDYHPEDGSEHQDRTDKENYPSDPPVERRSWTRISSVLADAQKHRILLHSRPCPQPPPTSIMPEKYVPSLSSQESRALCKQANKGSFRNDSLPTVSSGTLLPSDDSLNLFACPTSSPSRY